MEVLTFAVVALAVVALVIVFQTKYVTKKVKIGNTTIEAEIADTFTKQIKGLMFRKDLEKNKGMLFVFNNDSYQSIWMMNMSFPLDIIWIDAKHKIVDIVKDAQPCMIFCTVYRPKEKARYVLEANAGFVDKHGIEIGDNVKF